MRRRRGKKGVPTPWASSDNGLTHPEGCDGASAFNPSHCETHPPLFAMWQFLGFGKPKKGIKKATNHLANQLKGDTQPIAHGGCNCMALIGLTEAAKLTGKDKATIHRAMKSGRISFTVSDTGERQIDPAELERAFPIKAANDDATVAARGKKAGCNDTQLAAQLETERAERQRERAQLEGTIDDLRRRLDMAEQERRDKDRQLTALLAPPTKARKWSLFGKRESA